MPKLRLVIVLSLLILFGCAHLQRGVENHSHSIAFFVVVPGFAGAELGDAAVRSTYESILSRTGHASPWGQVGIALNYPYTAFLTGSGPDRFELDVSKTDTYERLFRIAHEMKIQVLVGLNGGPWAEPEGPFNAFWKTAHAGKYLSLRLSKLQLLKITK